MATVKQQAADNHKTGKYYGSDSKIIRFFQELFPLKLYLFKQGEVIWVNVLMIYRYLNHVWNELSIYIN
jgi:hypothetical protein